MNSKELARELIMSAGMESDKGIDIIFITDTGLILHFDCIKIQRHSDRQYMEIHISENER